MNVAVLELLGGVKSGVDGEEEPFKSSSLPAKYRPRVVCQRVDDSSLFGFRIIVGCEFLCITYLEKRYRSHTNHGSSTNNIAH